MENSSYKRHARDFVRAFAPYCAKIMRMPERKFCYGGYTYNQERHFYGAIVRKFNARWGTTIKVAAGASRVVFIGKDFVVKVDRHGEEGTCATEMDKYEKACKAGMEEYLLPIEKYVYNGLNFYIMPRASVAFEELGEDADLGNYVSSDVFDWLYDFTEDLHWFNWGFWDGKAVVFDYAW